MLTPEQVEALLAVPPRERFRVAVAWDGRRQNALAATVGVSVRVMSYLLRHATKLPAYDVAIGLAWVLGVPPSVLWGGATTMPDRSPADAAPRHWRTFAARYDLPVTALITQAVECYIDTTEAHEQGYRPWPVEHSDEPLIVLPITEFRRAIGLVGDEADQMNDRRFLSRRHVREVTAAREAGHSWRIIAADFGLHECTLRERYERTRATMGASA